MIDKLFYIILAACIVMSAVSFAVGKIYLSIYGITVALLTALEYFSKNRKAKFSAVIAKCVLAICFLVYIILK